MILVIKIEAYIQQTGNMGGSLLTVMRYVEGINMLIHHLQSTGADQNSSNHPLKGLRGVHPNGSMNNTPAAIRKPRLHLGVMFSQVSGPVIMSDSTSDEDRELEMAYQRAQRSENPSHLESLNYCKSALIDSVS